MALLLGVLLQAAPASADDLKNGQWYANFLRLAAAHKVSTGLGVTVALIDSGVDSTHPDLKGGILAGADFSAGGQVSIGDGRTDASGHGTQMAGLIVGSGKVAGVAPASKIVPINSSFTSIGGTSSTVAEGIRWAVEHGVQVISISSAGPDDPLLRQAIEVALASDIVVIAGAGNVAQDAAVGYPAAYPGVIAACGVDRLGKHSSVSVTGAEVVLCAPSDGISSTFPGGKYALGSGTSESTAIIAGAVALVRAKFPELSGQEVVHRLTATADDKGVIGRDEVYGFGVINVVDALTENIPTNSPSAGPTVKATATAPSGALIGGLKPWHVALGGLLCLLVLVAVAGTAGVLVLRRRR
ncbi:MAG: S8 family serine peptidase [Hamadaea sp.]|uniref:S8 family serine peptidase n=1 Tax=Hamadaea sp. TaxID=2024425 RepID=UPI0017B9BFCD|nr:S8 family serine peptidase [Hamadaea sp.]NUT19437.1 S8 family serine peptidase [Hamadaea sp.]